MTQRGGMRWRQHLGTLALGWALILALFARDGAHLVTLWWTSSTFTHCLLILPVLGWLAWLRAPELAKLNPHGWWPGLLWTLAGAIVWLVGEAASVALFRQIGLIVMLQSMVPLLLGPQVTRGLIFPLFYSLFLVPMGEELVPPMQTLTAQMAMGLLHLAGIPALLEGIFITTPGGYFAVAEACSGVKFLVAMAALAVLAAHLCFTSWRRRAVFLLVALLIPALANGVRAFGTIWMAEYWGTDFARGADHVIYGWFFFGGVMALLGALAWPWFDRSPDAVPVDAALLARTHAGRTAPLFAAAALAIAVALAPMLWLGIGSARAAPLPALASVGVPGWRLLPSATPPADDWRARFDGADQRRDLRFADASGRVVDVTIAGYVRQGEGHELVGFGQGAADPDSDWAWGETLGQLGAARLDRIAARGEIRDVATLYRLGGAVTAESGAVKLRTLIARLSWGDERGYALVAAARRQGDAPGRIIVRDFLTAAGGADALLRRLTTSR